MLLRLSTTNKSCRYFFRAACHREALEVRSEEMPLQQAQQIPGLRAVFGEVYPDPVRVVSMRPKVRAASTLRMC
jgi:alanyl-tRNA synthetase